MPFSRGPASINCDAHAAVGRVLEAGRHTKCAGELAMNLGLCRPGTNRAPRDEICSVLWGDGVKKFTSGGEPNFRNIKKQLSSDAETPVDAEGSVHVGVIYKTFPADCCTRLLEVDAHDDVQVILSSVGVGFELLRIFDGGLDVVH